MPHDQRIVPTLASAAGMVDERWVMVAATLVSIAFMLFFAKPIGVSSGFRAKGLNLRQICDSGAVENLYNFE